MKKTKLLIFILALHILGKVQSQKIDIPISKNPKYSTEIENRITKVLNNLQVKTSVNGVFESKTLNERMKYYHTPAVSIAVVNNGKIEWSRGFGKSDLSNNTLTNTETLFQAGSVSKPIFALTVMKLHEQGVIDLDKNINEYLTSWKIPKNGNWQPKITFSQLLSHTAGVNIHGFLGYLKNENVPNILQILNGDYPSNTPAVKVNILPNTKFRYSGGGITIAQLAFTDLLKKPFTDLIDQYLFTPLNLKNSTYSQPLPMKMKNQAATAYPYKFQPIYGKYHTYPEMAAAGLWSTPTELATIMIEIQKALKGDSKFIQKQSIEKMLTPQKVAKWIGIGFMLEGKDGSIRFKHDGWDEGFISEFKGYKNIGKGIVIMINSNEGRSLIDEIINSVAIEYKWPNYIQKEEKLKAVDQAILKHIGTYGKYKIDYIDEKLFLTYSNQSPIELKKTSKETYRTKDMNFEIKFVKNQLIFTQEGESKKIDKK